MTHRLLLVEQSATMRYVLEKHAQSLGYAVDARESYSQAAESLTNQFQQYGAEYSGVMFGWPTATQEDASRFAQQLEGGDHKDLPVVVMSTDMRAETRAWAAGRDHTKVLAWKEYQGLEALLQQLIDVAPAELPGANEGFAVKFDNRDIHLLIVDDSATIRYSLRDLFQVQGYRVTLAATRDEAMRYATSQAFDIGILDYYLTETTGDVLCREILSNPTCGDIVCTVLTGTYSDHIIKRSLRSGAVECMFKNESSDLLLSRIDAISRFVWIKRQLQAEHLMLGKVLGAVAGALLLIDDKQQVAYLNTRALQELGIANKNVLMGTPAEAFLGQGVLRKTGKSVHEATWTLPDGRTVDVDYQHSQIEAGAYALLRFVKRTVAIAGVVSGEETTHADPDASVEATLRQFSFRRDCAPFFKEMALYLQAGSQKKEDNNTNPNVASVRVSLLVLDVFAKGHDNSLVPVSRNQHLATQVLQALEGIIKRSNHMVAMTDSRYAFLLRHVEDSQAFVLTRRIMQICLEATKDQTSGPDEPSLACTASMLSLTRNASQPMNVLVQHAFNGMDIVNSREPNQAILLDVRRLLAAYPAQSA